MKPQPLNLLYRDDDLVAVEKPAGIAVIPGRGETDSVLEALARQLGIPAAGAGDPRVRVVHRLDKDTSGVVLYALHVAAQRHLSHQFQNNTVRKEYLAIVSGRPSEDEGVIDAPIGHHPGDKLRMTVTKHGRPAVTAWRVEERYREHTLVRCFPKTGKTHQIRVHLKHVGLPLAIDPLYNRQPPGAPAGLLLSSFKRGYQRSGRGQPGRGDEERPLIARLTLHAHKLTFVKLDGAEQTVIAEPPKDFRAVLNMLGKYSRA